MPGLNVVDALVAAGVVVLCFRSALLVEPGAGGRGGRLRRLV